MKKENPLKKFISEKLPAIADEFNSYISDMESIADGLTEESDRGCVLVTISIIEKQLEDILRKRILGSNKQLKELFTGFGPMSSFSAKIKLAYSFGIITSEASAELDRLKRIRNLFAHDPNLITFESKNIISMCESLEFALDVQSTTTRKRFISSQTAISTYLKGVELMIKRIKEPPSLNLKKNKAVFEKQVREVKAKKKES